MAIQAFFFFLPKLVWHLALSNSEKDVRALLDAASKLYLVPDFGKKKLPSNFREKQLIYLNSRLFDDEKRNMITKNESHRCSRICSCYFILCYIGVKVLYLLNCIIQIGFIQVMIGSHPLDKNHFNHLKPDTLEKHFIAQFVNKINSGVSELIDTSSFPKRTLCDFTFRELASNHAYTVECILPLNIIVEKMYAFMHIWFIFLGLIIFIDLFKWIGHLIHCVVISDRTREHYVRTHLIDKTRHSAEDIAMFAKTKLTGNTYFLLKLLTKNISTFVVVDMFDYYFKVRTTNKKHD